MLRPILHFPGILGVIICNVSDVISRRSSRFLGLVVLLLSCLWRTHLAAEKRPSYIFPVYGTDKPARLPTV